MTDELDEMTDRRALALGVMACQSVAADAPDVVDWRQAACRLAAMLAELQGPCAPWVPYSRARARRNGGGDPAQT